jgi:hypothetical protein
VALLVALVTGRSFAADEPPVVARLSKVASVRNLLMARSGVYLPSGNGELTVLSPRRGSYSPGAYFQYSARDMARLDDDAERRGEPIAAVTPWEYDALLAMIIAANTG